MTEPATRSAPDSEARRPWMVVAELLVSVFVQWLLVVAGVWALASVLIAFLGLQRFWPEGDQMQAFLVPLHLPAHEQIFWTSVCLMLAVVSIVRDFRRGAAPRRPGPTTAGRLYGRAARK